MAVGLRVIGRGAGSSPPPWWTRWRGDHHGGGCGLCGWRL